MINDLYILVNRYVKSSLKVPFFIIMAISQPLMYLLLFGSLFSATQLTSNTSYNYIEFLTPGMIVLAAMFSSAYLGVNVLQNIKQEFFDRLILSTTSQMSIPLSYVIGNLFTILLVTVILVVVGIVAGGFPAGGIIGITKLLLPTLLISIAFASISCAIAYLAKMQEVILGVMNFVTLPLMFTSNMMISQELMPHWIKAVSQYNPITWAVSLAQQAYLNNSQTAMLSNIILLFLFGAVPLLLMLLTFKYYIKNN